jgi:hypothetical protein
VPTNQKARVCVFDIYDLAPADGTAMYRDIITDELEAGLTNILELSIVPENAWRGIQRKLELSDRSLVLGGNAMALADASGADLAVTGFYRVEQDRILIEVKCYSVRQKRLIAGFLERGRLGLSLYNLINDAVLSIQPGIEADLVSLQELIKPRDPRLARVELLSEDEGAEIFYGGESLAGTIVSGRLEVVSAKGRSLILEIRKDGFHTARVELELGDEQRQSHRLPPLIKATTWASEVSYTAGQMLGLGMGVRYYFIPDTMFVGLRDYLYIQHEFDGQSHPLLHNDTQLVVGSYLLFGPESRFRLGISTGFGVIVTGFSAPDLPTYTDFYFNAMNGWLEINLSDWAIFLQVEGKFGMDIGDNLLAGQWYLVDESIPPLTLGVVKKW